MTKDGVIKEFAAKAQAIYDNRTAGDHTWEGLLAAFAHRYEREDGRTITTIDMILMEAGYDRPDIDRIARIKKYDLAMYAAQRGLPHADSMAMNRNELVQTMIDRGMGFPAFTSI